MNRMSWPARIVIGAVLMAVAVVGTTALRVWQVARIDDQQPVDAVVVLGAAQYNGEPSSVLAARLRHAAQLFDDGVAPRIVTVGGSQSGDQFTEAEASRNYLIGRGVPASSVIAVNEGADTLRSVQAVAAKASEQGWESALLVSDPWHSLRARTMARDAGLDAWTSPTRSGPMVQTREAQFRYIYRETGALLFYELTHAPVDTATSGLG
nr:YdcF family protein [Pseudonocardia sediminis]